jgi:hypothetical protein
VTIIVLSDVKFDSAGVSAIHETRAGVRHGGRGSLICFLTSLVPLVAAVANCAGSSNMALAPSISNL